MRLSPVYRYVKPTRRWHERYFVDVKGLPCPEAEIIELVNINAQKKVHELALWVFFLAGSGFFNFYATTSRTTTPELYVHFNKSIFPIKETDVLHELRWAEMRVIITPAKRSDVDLELVTNSDETYRAPIGYVFNNEFFFRESLPYADTLTGLMSVIDDATTEQTHCP